MESTNNGGDKGPTRLLLPRNEIFSAKNELYLIELLAKWTCTETPNNLGYCQGYLLAVLHKLLLKTIPTKLTEHGEVKL